MEDGRDFEWDREKAEINFAKHGVTFETATEVFFDPLVLIVEDDRFQYDETRLVAFGAIRGGVLVVVHVEREDNVTRIISARHATPKERRRYANG